MLPTCKMALRDVLARQPLCNDVRHGLGREEHLDAPLKGRIVARHAVQRQGIGLRPKGGKRR